MGSMITAFQGNPTFSTLTNVKNPGLNKQINSAAAGAGTLNSNAQASLADYITKYMGGLPAAQQRTNQEVASVDSLYNGGMAQQLAALRAAQMSATNAAANVATQQALRGLNAGRLGEQGAGSSYDARMAIGALQPIAVQAALTNAGQARTDLGTLTGLQLGNLGVAQGLANQQAAYGMQPVSAAEAVYGQNLNNLNGLAGLYNANDIYGVQQNKTTLDEIGNFFGGMGSAGSSFMSTMGNNPGLASSLGMGGMFGPGGSSGGMSL